MVLRFPLANSTRRTTDTCESIPMKPCAKQSVTIRCSGCWHSTWGVCTLEAPIPSSHVALRRPDAGLTQLRPQPRDNEPTILAGCRGDGTDRDDDRVVGDQQ